MSRLTRITGIRLWSAILLLLGSSAAQARNAPLDEYEIKALFLYHFAGFVTWPPDAFADDSAALVIGIVGDDPFGPYLVEAVQKERAQGRRFAIAHYAHAADVGPCHILFVAPAANDEVDAILARVKGQPVLTVGDSENFARRGGIVRFLTANHRTRFRINLTAVKEANLVISSKLLRSADVIEPGKGKS
jgi:hypothetical protein